MNGDSRSAQVNSQLLGWACDQLQTRLRAGVASPLDELFGEFPALLRDPHCAARLAVVDYKTRLELGQNPDPEELFHRFPDWRPQLESEFARLSTREDEDQATILEKPKLPTEFASPSNTLAPHHLLEVIGRGGMGVVHKAYDVALDRIVALKMIRHDVEDPSHLERFQREARAAARPRHPNIIPIYAVGLLDHNPCISMPFISGGTLEKHRAALQSDLRKVVRLMETVARAVHAAHLAGVIHRDLKPGNILLDENGEPMVADFGLAKMLDGQEDVSGSGVLVGTPLYMAPEQLASERKRIGPAVDIWALGIMLYEFVTGRRAFKGRGPELLLAICKTEPVRPRSVRPDLPVDLETIVLRCLQKKPTDRYPTAQHLANDLHHWLEGEAIAPPPRPLVAPPPSFWRRPIVRTAGGVLALLLLILFVGITTTASPGSDVDPAMLAEARKLEQVKVAKAAALKRVQGKVDSGEETVLLDANGQEEWYRWISPKDQPPLKKSLADGRHLTARRAPTILELLPRIKQKSYEVSADLYFSEIDDFGVAGLYVMGEQLALKEGMEFRCLAYHLTTDGPRPKFQPELVTRTFLDLNPGFNTDRKEDRVLLHPRNTVPLAKWKWYTIKLQVKPKEFTLFLDGKKVYSLAGAKFDFVINNPVDASRPLDYQGGIGLILQGASVQFKNVVLKPLD